MDGGELVDGLMEFDGIIMIGQIGGGFANFDNVLKPELVIDVDLVAGIEPVGDVFGIELDGMFGHFGADGFVSCALIEEVVDEAAVGFGELGDLAAGLATG